MPMLAMIPSTSAIRAAGSRIHLSAARSLDGANAEAQGFGVGVLWLGTVGAAIPTPAEELFPKQSVHITCVHTFTCTLAVTSLLVLPSRSLLEAIQIAVT